MATGKDILAAAVSQLGVKESPPDSNRVKYNTWYYGREVSGPAYPWCMAFVQWCYAQAGAALPFKTASCGALLRWYREHQPECIVKEPEPGDIVIFDFPGGAATDHTGVFERLRGDQVTTVDGNTGTANDADGGAVMRRARSGRLVAAYIRPRELEDDMKRYQTIEEIKQDAPWAAETVEKLVERKALGGTGAGLDLSADMLRLFVVNDRMGLYPAGGK
ncbi:MAG: CHAP domain-containing protein [Oscillospiraceae bacterium]|nr:CHAP domain-containing protein [Oscillospiraceae bacterium]